MLRSQGATSVCGPVDEDAAQTTPPPNATDSSSSSTTMARYFPPTAPAGGGNVANGLPISRFTALDDCRGRDVLGTSPTARADDPCDGALNVVAAPPGAFDEVGMTRNPAVSPFFDKRSRSSVIPTGTCEALGTEGPCGATAPPMLPIYPGAGERRNSQRVARTLPPCVALVLAMSLPLSLSLPPRQRPARTVPPPHVAPCRNREKTNRTCHFWLRQKYAMMPGVSGSIYHNATSLQTGDCGCTSARVSSAR